MIRSQLPSHLDPGFNTDQHLNVSTERIRSELGYVDPIPPDAALARTITWERMHPPENIAADQYDCDAEDRPLEIVE